MSTFNPLETPSFLTNYDIQERIGTGSFGLVYKAKQKDRNQLLVIKQIPFSTKDNSTELQEARNEANILSKLNNRYVVKYYNSFEEGGYLYIIMEYCEGGDLSSYLSKMQKLVSHLTEIQIWKFFIQMSLGLAYIHYKKILHRDLKSLNIFLTKNLDVKIGDLGVAKILQNTIHAYTFIGTPYYLSPEILEEKPYNEKSDVWALGCILYEMATFKHPYNASNQAALFLKIKNGKYEPLGNHYTHELKKMIQTLLDKNSFSRPSMKQILEMQIFLDKAKYLGLYDTTIEMLSKLNNNNQNTNVDNNSNNNNNNSHSNSKNYSGKKLLKSRQIKLIQIESNKKLNGKNISQVIKNDYNNYKNEMFEKHKQKRKTSEDLNSKQNNNNNNNNNNHKRVRKAPSPSLIELPSNNNVKKIKNTNIRIKSHLHNINNKNAKPRVNESYDNARQSRGMISKIKLEPNKNFHSFLKNNNPIIKNNDKESKHSSNSHNRVSSARNNNSEDHLKHYIFHKKANSKSKPTLDFVIINENTKEYEKTNKNENINDGGDNNKQYNKDIHISIQSNFNEPPSNIKVKKFINYLNKQNNIKQQNRNFYNSNPINYKKSVSTSTKNIRSSYNSNCNNSNSNIQNRVCSSSSKEKSQLTHLQINNYSNDNCSSEMKRFINELNQKIPTLEDNNKNINNKRKKIKFKQPKQQQYPSQTETCLPSETFYVEEAGNHKMFPFKKEEYSNDEHELFNYSGSEDENNNNNKSLGELENDLETDCNNNNNEKCYSFTDESKSQKQEDENSSEGDEEKVSIVKNTNRFVHKEQEFINQLQKEYNDLKGKLMSFSHVINFNELLEIYSQIGNKNTQIEKTKNDIEQYIYEHIKEPEMAKTYSKLFEKWISAEIKLKNYFDN